MVGQPTMPSSDALSQRIKNIASRTSPHIHITFNDHHDDFVATFSTLDKIEGSVTITYPMATKVKNVAIEFVGTSKTFVERLTSSTAISGRTEAFHQFLKLAQPIPRDTMPRNKVFEANKPYTFDFIFVIPPQLLPRVCRHTVGSSTVHQEHLNLPPSLGDKNISGRGRALLDDFAPDMARIGYAVAASVQDASVEGTALPTPTVRTKGVRIIPAIDEKAPLSADGPDSDYILRSEKDIRKGVFKGKLGRIVMESSQPKSIEVSTDSSDDKSPESTVVTVNLRFDPVDDKATPPKLGNLGTKLKVSTFFSSAARARLPSKKDIQWDLTQGLHSETISLASRCVAAAEWKEHSGRAASPDATEEQRRGSTTSFSSLASAPGIPEPSTKYTVGQRFWTAQVVVPITLPTTKAWLPTFHTCLISRIYGLSLHLGLPGTASMDLKLPVQISCAGGAAAASARRGSFNAAAAQGLLSAEEMAVEAADAEDFFTPRTVSPMDASLVGGSSIGLQRGPPIGESELPPGYDDFPRHGSRVPVAV